MERYERRSNQISAVWYDVRGYVGKKHKDETPSEPH